MGVGRIMVMNINQASIIYITTVYNMYNMRHHSVYSDAVITAVLYKVFQITYQEAHLPESINHVSYVYHASLINIHNHNPAYAHIKLKLHNRVIKIHITDYSIAYCLFAD